MLDTAPYELVLLASSAISALLKLRDQNQYTALKTDINALIDQIRSGLPKNADGTPFTDAQIHALAAQAHAVWADVALRAQAAQIGQ